MKSIIDYPTGAEFAFTILDDTDDTTVAKGKPVYNLLDKLGLRTTKTVWAFDTAPDNRGPYYCGETLSSPKYLEWVKMLAESGFEIAFHNATMGTSEREDTIKALDIIESEFGKPVRIHCNHGQNLENLHWGADRYSTPALKSFIHFLNNFRPHINFEGNKPGSKYYWSDVAAERLSYMRAFAFRRLNGLIIPPGRPFRDPDKQWNPIFFNTADASDVTHFNELVNPASIDKLRRQRGWAIVSTHFGKGFYWEKRLNTEFRKSMEFLASQPGWFVPVSQLLDFLSINLGTEPLTRYQRTRMEYAHLLDRIGNKILSNFRKEYWQMKPRR